MNTILGNTRRWLVAVMCLMLWALAPDEVIHAAALSEWASNVPSDAPVHPMPNTVIAMSINSDGVTLGIAVPMPELRLAMQNEWPPSEPDSLTAQRRAVFETYFRKHLTVRSRAGDKRRWTMQSMTIWETSDQNVGTYQELRLRVFVGASPGFDVRRFALDYDAVIHQVPNHFVLVQKIQDFAGGVLSADRAVDVGVIRYDFARSLTPSLQVDAGSGNRWSGVHNMMAIGFHHVMSGWDHLLFLATLLIVAPLRVEGRTWSLFQGWRYTARRFLGISIAFTIGHSIALAFGAYQLVSVPQMPVEVLVAVSIGITALHAIRPLFPEREWMVAAAFGAVHGLAFAERLSELVLDTGARALAVGGFNVGIEAAQLTIMLCALPVFFLSRWRVYNGIRLVSMAVALVAAAVWAGQRVVAGNAAGDLVRNSTTANAAAIAAEL